MVTPQNSLAASSEQAQMYSHLEHIFVHTIHTVSYQQGENQVIRQTDYLTSSCEIPIQYQLLHVFMFQEC